MNKEISSQALSQAASAVHAYLNEKSLDIIPLHLFKAMATLTDDWLERVKSKPEDTFFDSNQLLYWLKEHKLISPTDNPDYIKEKFKELENRLSDDARLRDIAIEKGLTHYGLPAKVSGGGRGRKTRYSLKVVPISEKEIAAYLDHQETYNVPEGGVRYIEQNRNEKPPFGSRWAHRFEMKGWKAVGLFLLIMIPIFDLVLFGFIPLTLQFFPDSLPFVINYITASSIIWGFAALFLLPFYRLMDKRVAFAPQWMNLSSMRHYLMEYRPIRDKDGKSSGRKIYMVHYKADCPVCGGDVVVERGWLRFPGRYVGKCNENPVEHVYSFDHVTQTGKPLC